MTQQGKKMSSVSPLPPPTPPAQKPMRIVKARPPMRPRPYLPPRPTSDKLNPSNHAAPLDSSVRVIESAQELESESSKGSVSPAAILPEPATTPDTANTPEPAILPEPVKEHLNLKHSGNVKKIVGQFDHGVVQNDKEILHPPPLPEKRLPPQPTKPARVPRRSNIALPPPKSKTVNFALNGTENGVEEVVSEIGGHGAVDKMDSLKKNHLHREEGSQWGDYEVQARDKARVCFDGVPATDSTAITSPKSIDWESRLQDEPLYQTYRQTVIRKEIKRQAVPRNCSITSFDVNTESSPTSSEYGGNSPRSRRSITPQNTLWQELPAVRESGILEKMSMDERKMQESMFEVLTSEASYRRSLSVLTEHFMESRELDDTIIIREKKILFSNILKVKEVSERFLKDLEERVDESLYITDICDIIYEHAQQSFLVYIDYVRNQVYQEKTYSSLMERNVQFATVIARLQELPQCQRLPFMSFLLLPFQRITRIKMLIENILKRSEEGSIREQNALKALESVSKIIEECNSEVGRMKQMEELILITKTIEFDKTKAVPIISQARYLEKQGELSEYIQKGSLFSIKPKFTPVYFFLFNDFLLITHRKSSERHVVVDYAHRSLVQVQDCVDSAYGSTMENGFFLTLLENHQGKTCDRLFKAPTQSDMHRWMGAFPNKKEPKQSSDETIYEDWDCPQVQCVEAYTATQADELSLEPTDIINILRKTTEGWYEGIRLSDGKKGWFPSKYVQEITNEHVRRRNLRERYRVLQAARQIQTMPYDPKKKYCST
ncbi:rho guanine nucleotide exchange factor 15 isoform X3 [Ambystoma mexicanum]|uniref:rho guanine nucleotide exchange factor 15 isoform X3 n=1 Tax=Ambystoma mexicanum TaxID=8296 RepID=UPI0037E95965